MHIQDVTPFIVGTPPPHWGGMYWIFVRLRTDDGIEGIGEVYAPPFHPRAIPAMIEDVAQRLVIGRDPFQVEALWREMYGQCFTLRPDLSVSAILSGMETACWDIMGKATGKPVCELLGGRVRDRLRTYTYIYPQDDDRTNVYQDPILAAERALHYVEAGFDALKFDPLITYGVYDPRQLSQHELKQAETYTATLRDALGSRADLLVGTHGQMSPAAAIRLARRLEPFDPLWFEEPTPPDRPEGLALVARNTTIPIATGERLVSKYEFLRVLEGHGVAILQMALGRAGGILECKKIAGMAEAFHVHIAPHLYCGPVEAAANIHLSACSPNFLIMESIQTMQGFHGELLKQPLHFKEGYLTVPTTPGLGIEINEEVALAHPYDGEQLHLSMASTPIG